MIKNRKTLVLISIFASAAQAAPYTIIDLGELTDESSFGNGLSSNGVVVGQFQAPRDANNIQAFESHGFIFDGTFFTDIGTLEPDVADATSAAQDVNDNGQVVGFSQINVSTDPDTTILRERAIIFENGVLTDLGLPESIESSDSKSISINNAGLISGFATTLRNAQEPEAAFFEQAAIIDPTATGDKFTLLGSLVPLSSTDDTAVSSARASNLNGQITGWSTTELDGAVAPVHAFYIDPLGTGLMVDMGTLGGNRSSSSDINESGVIVGRADVEGSIVNGFHVMAFKFDLANDTELVPLGVLNDEFPDSVANGINDLGQVVGFSIAGAPLDPALPIERTHAVLFENGLVVDLDLQIDCPLGWTLALAKDINNNGQIVGSGVLNGKTHGFLLTPDPTGGAAEACVDPLGPDPTDDSSGGSMGLMLIVLLSLFSRRRFSIKK